MCISKSRVMHETRNFTKLKHKLMLVKDTQKTQLKKQKKGKVGSAINFLDIAVTGKSSNILNDEL